MPIVDREVLRAELFIFRIENLVRRNLERAFVEACHSSRREVRVDSERVVIETSRCKGVGD